MTQSTVHAGNWSAALLVSALLMGCHATPSSSASTHGPVPVVASGDSTKVEAAFNRLAALQGEWELVEPDGKRGPGLSISVTSAGSAVREIMFAGSPHEMTNLYHADGGSILMTHYCAMGNQPRMRAKAPDAAQPFSFGVDSVTNLRGRDETYMGSMVLTILDPNTIRQDWRHYTLNAGMGDEPTSMTFKRKGT